MTPHAMHRLAILFAAGCIGGAAHAQPKPKPPSPAPKPAATCKANEPSFFRDEGMTMKVATKLQFNKALMREKINAKVTGGVAVLSGSVPTAELIAEAGRLAGEVEGVHCVSNQLVIGAGG